MFFFNTLKIKDIKNSEILILGSSLAKTNVNHFVIEDIKGIKKEKILNFGFSYGTPFDMYVNVLKYKKYLKNVKTVFIGLEPFILTEKYYINKFYEKFLLTKQQLEYIKKYHTNYIEKYNPCFWNFDCKKIEKNCNIPIFNEIYNGFEPRIYTEFEIKTEDKVKLIFEPINLFNISRFQIKSLKKILSFFKNSQIYFILSPSFNFYNIYEKMFYQFDIKLVELLKKELGNIQIIGELKNNCLERTDFFDDIHLNLKGSTKFTESILKQKATNIFDINSLLDVKMFCEKSKKNYFWEQADKFITKIKIFIGDKKNIALIGNTNIAKLIKFSIKDIDFIIFDDYKYDGNNIFSTKYINDFQIDKVIQTYFGSSFNTKLELFKLEDENRILHTQLEMYFSISNKLDRRNCF